MSKRVKLGDVCDLSIGFVGTVTSQYEEGGIPFLRTLNVKPYKIVSNDLKRITLAFHQSQKKSMLKSGDVVMVHTGVPGICCVIPDEYDNSNCIDMIVIRPHKNMISSHYLAAYMNTIGYKHIEKIQVGCIQKHFNLKDAVDFPIYLPSIDTQNRIGDFVERINDKIEINNTINAELEALAKTIYDYWFLQFEFPNEEGLPYKSSGGKMVWSEELKREIPEGWGVGVLNDIANIVMGSSPKGETINENGDGIVFYQGNADFDMRYPINRTYTTSPIRFAEEDAILLSVRAPVGSLNIASEKCCIGRGVAGIHAEHKSYVYYLLRSLTSVFDKYNNNGTTFGCINKEALTNMKILIPNLGIREAFEKVVVSGELLIKNNTKENRELAALRDWLLPMLMNGQVGFKE